MKREFHQTRDGHSLIITIAAPQGTYRPAARDLILETQLDFEPKTVMVRVKDAPPESLPHLNSGELAKSSRGWTFSNNAILIKEKDPFQAILFSVKN